ncbi:rho GDP-dissociation inhibitor 1 isoform X1 [Pseudoliparis swirei]|uniref:rho GDP-dissociation inhibitor 1 isoform X1 n=1 Tax=Pseudoliparis swirei TaxID=2059687 RepID=UPI0024BD6165|nr:rho GDP-dissociation inhibitor 1 isoform X1 [Pseudoliparis swirei]XP_056262099.1 rho GDP-dissociation inhibitor 1 isoform X1 [Pseudoliparis swirei]
MAEQEPTPEQLEALAAANKESESSVNYKPPAQKSLQEIQQLDEEDESLRKYKEALLGKVATVADPSAPNVEVTRMTLVCETAPQPLVLDLKGDLDNLRKNPFVLKEGIEYRIKINFKVNKDIVSGLKYTQQTFRKGIKLTPLVTSRFLTTPSLLHSGQVGLHGGQLRAQSGRGVRVPDHRGGVPQGDAGPRHLQHQVQVHRRRRARPPLLGLEPHHQEGLDGLIAPRPPPSSRLDHVSVEAFRSPSIGDPLPAPFLPLLLNSNHFLHSSRRSAFARWPFLRIES